MIAQNIESLHIVNDKVVRGRGALRPPPVLLPLAPAAIRLGVAPPAAALVALAGHLHLVHQAPALRGRLAGRRARDGRHGRYRHGIEQAMEPGDVGGKLLPGRTPCRDQGIMPTHGPLQRDRQGRLRTRGGARLRRAGAHEVHGEPAWIGILKPVSTRSPHA
jgi:hypothetical protein